MKIKSEELIADLITRTNLVLQEAEKLNQSNLDVLNKKANSESWSVLECIEHLNRYGEFYLPEIQNKINNSAHSENGNFKSSWLGEYFATSMLPKEKLNTMKTFKNMNPNGSKLDKSVLTKFIEQQKKTLDLLNKSKKVSLQKTKTGISISSLIKLRLGDTFRVIIYHNQRHIDQAKRALALN